MTAPTSSSLLRRLRAGWPWLAAAASGALLLLCYPPYNQGWLVWIALTPLLAALWHTVPPLPADASRKNRWLRRLRPFLLGYLAGALFFIGTFHWLTELAALFESPALFGIPVLLGLYLALYFGFWGWFVARILIRLEERFDSSARNLAFGALAACAWVAHEWVRGWLFGGFSWNMLGVAMRQDLPMIQIADLTGVFGLSWLAVFTNVMAVIIVRRILHDLGPDFLKRVRWEFSASMLLVAAVFSYGVRALMAPEPKDFVELHVAVIQPNISEDAKKFGGEEGEEHIRQEIDHWHTFAALTKPELLIWPEATLPRGVFADDYSLQFVLHEAAQGDFSLLMGSLDYDQTPGHPDQMEIFNASMLFTDHGQSHETYRKIHLVPYGEYLPLRRFMPEAVEALIPGDLAVGKGTNVFTLPKPALRLGTLICFEDTDANLAGRFSQNGAQLLVNLTNDSWFGESEGAEQHLANAMLRAVEERRPLLRCTNSGVTGWVDSKGRVERWLHPFLPGFVSRVVKIPRATPVTFYARHGDWCAWTGAAITAVMLLLRLRRRAGTS